jgi:hypothetical protein
MAGDDPQHQGRGADHGVNGRQPPPRTLLERLSLTFLNPPKPKAKPASGGAGPDAAGSSGSDADDGHGLTDAERRARITQVDDTERKLGYAASILAAVIALIAFVPFINNPSLTVNKTATPGKGHTCATFFHYTKVNGKFTCLEHLRYPRSHWVTELLIVLVFALAIFITTRIKRRAALAFATLMTGLAMLLVVQSILAFAFILLGGWLMIRAWRVQRYGSPTAKGPARGSATRGSQGTKGAGSRGSGTRASGSGAAQKGGGRSRRRRGSAEDETGRPKPGASSRYTPPSPKRRKVPPPS